MMQKRIKDELNLNSSKISKISNTSFRVYLGPFDNLESLKNAFDDITPLNFENIEIIKL
jgi:cell division protein FtsN